MTQDELRSRVRSLLKLEQDPTPDWRAVEANCTDLSRVLEDVPTDEVPDLLWHFLNDADIRRADPAYADWQRSELWAYVESGTMVEHAPSISVSPWGCVAVIAIIARAVIWLAS